ncbi:MAG: glycosyl transferase family 1 [Nitrospirae bacterium RBG_16_64_22]|nr:MAG: glycosyl transferase family 1 [Nitrospirae bacterium RBG_16_64_22]
MSLLSAYAEVIGPEAVHTLERLAAPLRGRSFLHVNSTAAGGGVAEILTQLVPIFRELGLDCRWEVIAGTPEFFDVTKTFHNALQGEATGLADAQYDLYRRVNEDNARRLDLSADYVFIHDPQPAALIASRKGGKWCWRCHIDASHPHPAVWEFLRPYVESYDAAVFSMASYSQVLPILQFRIPPAIDPFSQKNRDLSDREIERALKKYAVPRDKPIILQVSRFDRFKDPLGVIAAYRMVKPYADCRLVLAGGTAADDPEGALVLAQVREAAAEDPNIHVLAMPQDDLAINALQRAAAIVLQKSTREGFGLTVSEALWKKKPVIAGAVGGLPLQVIEGATGYLVHSPEGAAFRIRSLLKRPALARRMGQRGRDHVRLHFLLSRQARDYLFLLHAMDRPEETIIRL